VVTCFVLTFLISWGGILVVLGPGAFTGATAPAEGLLPLVYLAMFAGPSVAGILMTSLVDGKAGFHDLHSRLLRWRVDVRCYVVALLTAPLVVTAVLLPLLLSSAGFLPGVFASDDKVSLLLLGLGAGLMTGLCEELGWTGFVIPRLSLLWLDVAGMRALTYDLVLAAALWLLIAALTMANGRQLSRPPLRPRVA
jgi:membrane protease YdiL (CAAX protease family)